MEMTKGLKTMTKRTKRTIRRTASVGRWHGRTEWMADEYALALVSGLEVPKLVFPSAEIAEAFMRRVRRITRSWGEDVAA